MRLLKMQKSDIFKNEGFLQRYKIDSWQRL